MNLIEEMIECRKDLEKNYIASGLWESVQTVGAIPDSREGSTGIVLGTYLYLFGGFSRDLYQDLRKIDLTSGKRWILYHFVGEKPPARFNHTMVAWKNKYLIIFGGAATYLRSCKMRLCLQDLFIFDSHREIWKKIPE